MGEFHAYLKIYKYKIIYNRVEMTCVEFLDLVPWKGQ